jgi:hypothetical protein
VLPKRFTSPVISMGFAMPSAYASFRNF